MRRTRRFWQRRWDDVFCVAFMGAQWYCHLLPNWAVILAASTGGHPAASSEQCGAGGVSLEGEAGSIAGRAQRGMYSSLARNNSQVEYQITEVIYCSVCSFYCIILISCSLDEPESHSPGAGDRETNWWSRVGKCSSHSLRFPLRLIVLKTQNILPF